MTGIVIKRIQEKTNLLQIRVTTGIIITVFKAGLRFGQLAGKNQSTTNTRKITSSILYKPDPWMLPFKGKDIFWQQSLVIVSHIVAGKSTLLG